VLLKGIIATIYFLAVIFTVCILFAAETDPRLVEAIQRPATIEAIIYHFTRLAAHKRNTKGDMGFQILLEDIAHDLRYASEWAIVKACIELRNDPSPFSQSTKLSSIRFYSTIKHHRKLNNGKKKQRRNAS